MPFRCQFNTIIANSTAFYNCFTFNTEFTISKLHFGEKFGNLGFEKLFINCCTLGVKFTPCKWHLHVRNRATFWLWQLLFNFVVPSITNSQLAIGISLSSLFFITFDLVPIYQCCTIGIELTPANAILVSNLTPFMQIWHLFINYRTFDTKLTPSKLQLGAKSDIFLAF